MKKGWILFSVFGLALLGSEASAARLADEVDLMIGTDGLGTSMPGATTPFGMIQLSPDTRAGNDDNIGYYYEHRDIGGFSFTHLNGVGNWGDFGNFLVLPTTGPRLLNREQATASFSHTNELAAAGYYRVKLDRYHVTTELTAAPRAGMIRFTYPAGDSRIQIDLARRIGMTNRWLRYSQQSVRAVDDHTIEGYMRCVDKDGGWGHGNDRVNYTLFYRAAFSKPFAKFGVCDGFRLFEGAKDYTGTNVLFFAEFPTSADEQVVLRAGFSYVDVEGARKNLEHDLPDFDFDAARQRARDLWDRAFELVQIEGGSRAERRIFATSLCRAFFDPRAIDDVDGRFRAADDKIYPRGSYTPRTIFSGWDVFRSEFPFLTLVRPDVINDEINSLMEVMRHTAPLRKELSRWDIFGCLSGCMLGQPAISVILDAYEKGIRGFDFELAYHQCLASSDHYRETRPNGITYGSLSETLEYAYDDWCFSRIATYAGHPDVAARYAAYALSYTNCWCPEVHCMRTRQWPGEKGEGKLNWLPWKGKLVDWQGTAECNPYQQGWFVPQDVYGLIRLMGGDKAFTDELETFFGKADPKFKPCPYYLHGNEPDHHVVYLFIYGGKPWLTQKWTRRICAAAYTDQPDGLCGAEDEGQMSAWYILSAIGIHPVCPGDGIYLLTSPVFPQARLRVRGGTFTVTALDNSPENIYIQSATLNGRSINRAWLTYAEIMNGGELVFQMGPQPNERWGAERPKGGIDK